MDDEDAPMCAVIGGICLSWVAKCMSAPDLEVLAHCLVFLLVQMGFNHDIDLIVSCPVPVQGALAECRDVRYIQPHAVLCMSGFFGRCAMEGWIVVWTLRWR